MKKLIKIITFILGAAALSLIAFVIIKNIIPSKKEVYNEEIL